MRRGAVLLSLVVALGACRKGRAPAVHAPSSAPECLSIVGWNDLHGQLEPDAPHVDTGRVPAGGVVALADHVAALRSSGDAVVVVDAGDLFTGPMESTLAEGAPVIAAYNLLGIDAATIGNHEFDFGPVGYERVVASNGTTDGAGADGPRGALIARLLEAKFPFVSANIRTASGTAPPWPNVQSHVLIERGGFKVGVIGYTTSETPETTLRPNVEGLLFDDGAARVAESVRALRQRGANPVVLLAHASLDGELPQSLSDPRDPNGEHHRGEIARLLAAMGSDLPDVVVAGHRHAWMLGRVRGVPIVSSDQHGVGFARIRYCRSKNGVTFNGIERELAFANTPAASELGRKVATTIKPYVDSVRTAADEIVATIPRLCIPQGPNGTALAEQIAEAMLARARADGVVPAGSGGVAVVNAGGVRAALYAGPVRYRDLFAMLPFENTLATCRTTRAGLTRALGNLAARVTVRDRFPFGIAGAHITARRAKATPLEIAEVAVDDKTDDVTLVMPDFLLYGGDGFLNGVTCSATAVHTTRVREAYRALLAKQPGSCDGPPDNIKVEVQ